MTNIIGDIAGEYDTFLALLEKMPNGKIISVGDMVDRGPKSKEVLDFFMQPENKAILGNHEHMMLDYLENESMFYGYGVWFWNGGRRTLKSFGVEIPTNGLTEEVPPKYIQSLRSLPKYIELDSCLISHSFVSQFQDETFQESLKAACEFGSNIQTKEETTIIWNRESPMRADGYRLQIVGHNSQTGFCKYTDELGDYAICLDDSRQRKLTGMVLETGEIFQQDYI